MPRAILWYTFCTHLVTKFLNLFSVHIRNHENYHKHFCAITRMKNLIAAVFYALLAVTYSGSNYF